jgi:hypothetical protein
MAELVASHTLHGRTSIAMAVVTEVHAGGDLLLQHIARLHGSVAFGTMTTALMCGAWPKSGESLQGPDRRKAQS